MSIADKWRCAFCANWFNAKQDHVCATRTLLQPRTATLTEDDVRRIVREELAVHFANQPNGNNP